jgi:hypothetical protein
LERSDIGPLVFMTTAAEPRIRRPENNFIAQRLLCGLADVIMEQRPAAERLA